MSTIKTFVIKTTSICDLNCAYCYIYNLGNETYLKRDRFMSQQILETTARKISEYAISHGIESPNIIFHGGEPLLAGKDWIKSAVKCFHVEGGSRLNYRFGLQTNGVKVDLEWLGIFREYGISVGVSLDGPKHIHNRTRINHAGHGSYDDVINGLKLLLDPTYSHLFGGVLCVINPNDDGLQIYRHFRDLGVNRMDFIFPLEYNWNIPPHQYSEPNATPFADYLIPIFDDWWTEDNSNIEIISLYRAIKLMIGSQGFINALMGRPLESITIDTDGSLEPQDALRACGDGLTETGLNILNDPIEAMYNIELFQSAISGGDGLSLKCKNCSIKEVCGGGYLANRYSDSTKFDNPSIYCRDLWRLYTHMINIVYQTSITSTS